MMRRVLRWLAGTFAVAMIGCAVYLYCEARASHARADAAQVAEPIRILVDLSQAGVYEGTWESTFVGAHADLLCVELSRPFDSSEALTESLAGFDATLQIYGPDGTLVVDEPLNERSYSFSHPLTNLGHCPTYRLSYLPLGTCHLKLTIRSGAPLLADQQQQLVGRYCLCGLEYLPGQLTFILAAGCAILGAAVAIGLAIGYAHRRRESARGESSSP